MAVIVIMDVRSIVHLPSAMVAVDFQMLSNSLWWKLREMAGKKVGIHHL